MHLNITAILIFYFDVYEEYHRIDIYTLLLDGIILNTLEIGGNTYTFINKYVKLQFF
jgi:hypothetical protein